MSSSSSTPAPEFDALIHTSNPLVPAVEPDNRRSWYYEQYEIALDRLALMKTKAVTKVRAKLLLESSDSLYSFAAHQLRVELRLADEEARAAALEATLWLRLHNDDPNETIRKHCKHPTDSNRLSLIARTDSNRLLLIARLDNTKRVRYEIESAVKYHLFADRDSDPVAKAAFDAVAEELIRSGETPLSEFQIVNVDEVKRATRSQGAKGKETA